MARIDRIQTDHYVIPLPRALEDSMHGTMTGFEVVTARVTDSDGATGVGYTFTCGVNGGAIADILGREMTPMVIGRDAAMIEAIWKDIWWAFHYGGRGGPTVLAQSALDMALWDLKAVKAGLPLYQLLGGFDAAVPCYAGGIDIDLTPQELVEQTHQNIAHGHRAIKMKVGRDLLREERDTVGTIRLQPSASDELRVRLNEPKHEVLVEVPLPGAETEEEVDRCGETIAAVEAVAKAMRAK